MKKGLFVFAFLFNAVCYAQDSQLDYSVVHHSSRGLAHLLPLFTIHGVPKNQHVDDTLEILINHGYCVGFSKKYNQPRWAAYQVSKSKRDVDYERFPFFADDTRLHAENRIGTGTFGNGFDLGHLAPNAAINRQYAKLSQMETFLMSNICPQRSGLNQGVWQYLEAEILNRYPYAGDSKNKRNHVWVIIGPVFSDTPEYITRKNGVKVAIPDSFFCVLIRPGQYPYDAAGNADYLAFLFSQNLEKKQKLDTRFITSINEIERLTGLNLLPDLTRTMENKIENALAAELW